MTYYAQEFTIKQDMNSNSFFGGKGIMRRKISKVVLIISILSLIFAAGCSAPTKKDSSNLKLKIGALPIEDILPILVAERQGYFEEEGVEVELIPFQSAIESQSAIQAGQLDGMITDTIVAILLNNSGLDVKITSLTLGSTPKEGRFAIVAAPGSDINSPADLKGKTIGISNNSIIEYVTDGLLQEVGIDPSEVTKTSVPKIPVRVEMLLNNQIDAINVPDPLVSFAEFKGSKIILEDTVTQNLSQAVVIMTPEALKEKNEALRLFYSAYAKAVKDINSNPADFKDLLVDNVNIPEPIAESYTIQKYPEPQLPKQEEIENVIEWLDKKQLLKKPASYEDVIDKGLF